MFGVKATVVDEMHKVSGAKDRAKFENIRHAAFRIAKDAKASIVKSSEPSEPGSPPTTRGRGGKNLRGAIFTSADKESAVIGPRASYVGDVGAAHEFGESRKGDDFDERPFMRPALENNLDRFASDWQGSIGS
jgi:phage gpG-like protein